MLVHKRWYTDKQTIGTKHENQKCRNSALYYSNHGGQTKEITISGNSSGIQNWWLRYIHQQHTWTPRKRYHRVHSERAESTWNNTKHQVRRKPHSLHQTGKWWQTHGHMHIQKSIITTAKQQSPLRPDLRNRQETWTTETDGWRLQLPINIMGRPTYQQRRQHD